MTERKYLPTVAELIDRLSIVLMKSIFIPSNRAAYLKEIELIKLDITTSGLGLDPDFIYAVLILMLTNRFIWENENAVRTTPINSVEPYGYRDIAQKLIATHSINGVRSQAKNKIANILGERVDLKIDCLAADLPPDMGNWNVFE